MTTNNYKRFSGKLAIVTGTSSGIGLACARRLAEEGAMIAGIDIKEGDWQQVKALSPDSRFYKLDVSDGSAVKKTFEQVIVDYGRADILLTAAGISKAGPLHMLEEADWNDTIDVNLKGTYLCIKAVLPTMMKQHSGSIVTIASIEGLNGTECGSAYNASKGGVVILTKNLAMDYGRMGIRTNSICPGFIETPLLEQAIGQLPAFKDDIIRETKVGRLGKPEEIAAAASFLASDDASYVNGHSLVVDGGYSAGHSHGIVELMGLS
ncbi:oxidoreductase [Endozoicomonas sp. OPT23]|uniref:SDR family NAD(P)-dependent oxidoreductase n=1 Tax=Endozoicomonas sp. OPT23 TaxID=2072845 RepID=UPI00129A70AD|nr:SDR family NAD(P)-dependent oxidoreductase [Endozoicomonas sp. OPT23]MRI34464.1 oxidoreductase [Endozoicomonas sp. OPT23]